MHERINNFCGRMEESTLFLSRQIVGIGFRICNSGQRYLLAHFLQRQTGQISLVSYSFGFKNKVLRLRFG